MNVQSGKTYVGVVEDNKDPKKLGRCKIKVFGIFDDFELENIPWANPWKDLAGNEFAVPEVGKVVTVVFEDADINGPEFISSDHYNINLEKKLSGLSDTDYLTMKSLMFDHKTQVYVNEGEGLKLDHKFNLINIRDKSINVNLKDNFGKINLGTENSTQRAILGDNFLNWFDDFVQILMGSKGGPFLGNFGAPVIATPALLGSLQLYQQLKDPKFLSKNVYIVDNENVKKLDRIAEGQKGDSWQSTVKENQLTSKEPVPYTPTAGSSNTTFDQPPVGETLPATQSAVAPAEDPKPTPNENPDVKVIKEIIRLKSYEIYEEINKMNIVAVRNQCILPGDKYTDFFSDTLYVMYKKEDSTWDLKQFKFSTVPGLEFTINDSWLVEKNFTTVNPWKNSSGKKIFMKEYVQIAGSQNGDPVLQKGLPILVPSQYINVYYIGQYKGAKAMMITPGASQLVWRDIDTTNIDSFNPFNLTTPELITPNDILDNGIKIHKGYPGGINVGNWSEGSQVFSSEDNLNEFFQLCEIHQKVHGNAFTYTLVTKADWDEATKNVGIDKASDPLNPPPPESATQSSEPQSQGGTQSDTEQMVEKNKSEVRDVLGDGKLLVDISVSDVFVNGKVTTDDVGRLQPESIVFTFKSQPIPNQWEFYLDNVDFKDPSGEGVAARVTSLKPNKVFYDVKSEHELTEVGNYKIDITLIINNKDKVSGDPDKERSIKKTIEFELSKGSAASSSDSGTGKKDYIIGILNPTSEASKKIQGTITVENLGFESVATGKISGFPDGGSIGPIEGTPSANASPDELSKEMIRILEDSIVDKYQTQVKLVVLEKR